MDEDGNLNWDAPKGEWSIIRFGYTCTGSHVSTSSGDWQGSVLDYMSKEAFDFYWNDVVEPIFEAASEHVGNTLKYMEEHLLFPNRLRLIEDAINGKLSLSLLDNKIGMEINIKEEVRIKSI